MSSTELHEPRELLAPRTIEHHRAIASLMEELEAVDWYDQRVDACTDDELRGILAHNRDEEKEHAVMTLEWLRRHDPALDGHLRTYLFTDRSVVDTEADPPAAPRAADPPAAPRAADPPAAPKAERASGDGSLGIGSLWAAAGPCPGPVLA